MHPLPGGISRSFLTRLISESIPKQFIINRLPCISLAMVYVHPRFVQIYYLVARTPCTVNVVQVIASVHQQCQNALWRTVYCPHNSLLSIDMNKPQVTLFFYKTNISLDLVHNDICSCQKSFCIKLEYNIYNKFTTKNVDFIFENPYILYECFPAFHKKIANCIK